MAHIRYYLNVERCAYYWADGAAGNNIGGRKYIGGSRVLSARLNSVKDCTVYGLMEARNEIRLKHRTT